MGVQFKKNGIVASENIYESSGMNLVQQDQINNKYTYTPGTGNNSCIEGYTVDYSSCKAGEKVYCRIKVEWNGFDTSNTNGTFSMNFQGSNYNNTTSTWEWKVDSIATSALNNAQSLKTLVLSATSGNAVITSNAYTIPSSYPSPYTKSHMGIRTNYSNGTGWIAISELEVIPEKYYTSSSSALKVSNNYTSSENIYEF